MQLSVPALLRSFKEKIVDRSTLIYLAPYLVLAPAPVFIRNEYVLHILIVAMYYSILSSSWNLLAGFTGLFCLSTHTFSGLAGYISALMVIHMKISPVVSILTAALLITGISYFIGLLTLKMRGIYLALTTWAFAEVARVIIVAEYEITRGDLGLPVPPLFGTARPDYRYFYSIMLLSIAAVLGIVGLMKSRYGLYLRAMRDDEIAARSMGINVTDLRKNIFALSGFLAGIAGGFYAHYTGLLSPAILSFNEMGIIIVNTLVGGWGTITGPVVGAFLVEILSELARIGGAMRLLIFAGASLLMVRILGGGVVELVNKALKPRIKL